MSKINNRQEELFQTNIGLKNNVDYTDYGNFSTNEKNISLIIFPFMDLLV